MKIEKIKEAAKHMPPLPLLSILTAAALGAFGVYKSSMQESAAAIWLWAAAIFVPYYFEKKTFGPFYRMPLCKITGIAFLALSAALSYIGKYNASMTALIFAPMMYFGNFKVFSVAAVPVFIWTTVIPKTEYAHFIISYPLRIIGAEISAAMLNLFGFAAEAANTIITIDGKEIAVTAACSGIEQLEAMLLIGWLCAVFMHRSTIVRLLHFAMILPVILAVNSVRLTITLAGFQAYGDVFLSDTVHTWLGIASVVAMTAIFACVGLAFPKEEKVAK